MFSRLKGYSIFVLIIVICVLSSVMKCNSDRYYRTVYELSDKNVVLVRENKKLLTLTDGLSATIIIKDKEIEIWKRHKGKVVHKTDTLYEDVAFIPVEGEVEIEIEYDDSFVPEPGDTTTTIPPIIISIKVKDRGWCFRYKVGYNIFTPSLSLGTRFRYHKAGGGYVHVGRDLEEWEDFLNKRYFYAGAGVDYRLYILDVPNIALDGGVDWYPYRGDDKWQMRLGLSIFLK